MKNGTQKDRKPLSLFLFAPADVKRLPSLFLLALAVSSTLMVDLNAARFIGGALIAAVLLFILYRDIMRYKPSYIHNYHMLLLLGLMIVSTLVIGRVFDYLLQNLSRGIGSIAVDTAVYGIPIAAGAMLVTLLFDFHTAITFSFAISLLTGYWLSDPLYPLYTFVGSLTAAFSVIRCKKRSALLRGGFYVAGINVLIALIILVTKGDLELGKMLSSVVFAVFAGVSVTALVSVLLPILEYVFKITTDISLLELLDLNQPLMKTLMITAPGTYHHSVIVGSLVEAAA